MGGRQKLGAGGDGLSPTLQMRKPSLADQAALAQGHRDGAAGWAGDDAAPEPHGTDPRLMELPLPALASKP